MAVTPVLRQINALMRQRHPGLIAEIGALHLSSQGTAGTPGRLIWAFRRGRTEGGYPMDQGAKCIAFRKVGLDAWMRIKAPSMGITEEDYALTEEVLRSLYNCLDLYCSGDWEMGEEDWTPNDPSVSNSCIVLRQSLTIAVKVLDDGWQFATPQEFPATGELSLEGVVH